MESQLIALGLAVASGTAAGMRPYLAVLILGLAKACVPANISQMTDLALAQIPEFFADPFFLVAVGGLTVLDFFSDKIPYFDSLWDQIHAFIRPIVGGAVGLQVAGDQPAVAMAASTTLVGGASALTVHGGKTLLRAALNLLPEPITNWLVSLGEDVAAVVLVAAAVLLPPLAIVLALGMLVLAVVMMVKLRGAYRRWRQRRTESTKQGQGELANPLE